MQIVQAISHEHHHGAGPQGRGIAPDEGDRKEGGGLGGVHPQRDSLRPHLRASESRPRRGARRHRRGALHQDQRQPGHLQGHGGPRLGAAEAPGSPEVRCRCRHGPEHRRRHRRHPRQATEGMPRDDGLGPDLPDRAHRREEERRGRDDRGRHLQRNREACEGRHGLHDRPLRHHQGERRMAQEGRKDHRRGVPRRFVPDGVDPPQRGGEPALQELRLPPGDGPQVRVHAVPRGRLQARVHRRRLRPGAAHRADDAGPSGPEGPRGRRPEHGGGSRARPAGPGPHEHEAGEEALPRCALLRPRSAGDRYRPRLRPHRRSDRRGRGGPERSGLPVLPHTGGAPVASGCRRRQGGSDRIEDRRPCGRPQQGHRQGEGLPHGQGQEGPGLGDHVRHLHRRGEGPQVQVQGMHRGERGLLDVRGRVRDQDREHLHEEGTKGPWTGRPA